MIEQIGKRLLTSLFLLLLVFGVVAQDQDYFVISGKVQTDDGNVNGSTITISKNGSDLESISPPKTGRFRFEFEYNNEYKLVFKKEGFFKKIIVISAHVPNEVMERDSRFPPLTFMVNLFREMAGIDKSFTNKPVGRVYYNESIDNFDTEIFFSDIQIEETIEEAISQNDGLSKEERDIQKARELELAEREKDYDITIKQADDFFQQKKFADALTKYEYSSSLFPDRPYPKDRIAELQDLIASQQIADQKNLEQQALYQAAIDEADIAFMDGRYEAAQRAYQRALQHIPNDEYANSQLTEVASRFKQQQLDDEFAKIIINADQSYQSGDLEKARSRYVEAASLIPEKAEYPELQIRKIDEDIRLQAETAELDRMYNEAMQEANAAFLVKDYNKALLAYRRAAELKEGDELAKNKITETEAFILQLEKQELFDGHLADAEQAFDAGDLVKAKQLYQEALVHLPNENYPKTKIAEIDELQAREEKYSQLLAQANSDFDAGNLDQAKLLYQQASQIRDELEIQNKISEINQLIAQKELDANYGDIIKQADAQFDNQQFEPAKQSYNQALVLKSAEQYPKDQIRKIDDELAQLADQAEKEQMYQQAMSLGNTELTNSQYQAALTAFNSALTYKPADEAAQTKIRETESLIQQQETQQAYDDLLVQADQSFNTEQWFDAKGRYEQALQLLPNEQYPITKIAEIDQIVAKDNQFDQLMAQAQNEFNAENYLESKTLYEQAFAIKDESSIQDRIGEIDQILAQQELDRNYNETIATADNAFRAENYELAKTNYQQALELKAQESYPQTQIKLIDDTLAQLADLAEKEQMYQQAMTLGNTELTNSQYQAALTAFNSALTYKPADESAQSKIRETESLIQQQETKQAYDDLLVQADQSFNTEQWLDAKSSYEQALQLLANEQYPITKIAEIDQIIAKDNQFDQLMAQAQNEFNAENYQESKTSYEQAYTLKSEPSIQDRITEIDRILAQQELDRNYNEMIAQADEAYRSEQYELAKTSYQKSLELKAQESYPQSQIKLIDDTLAQLAQLAELDQQYAQAMQAGANYESLQNFEQALSSFEQALAVKTGDEVAQAKITEMQEKIKQQNIEKQYQAKITDADQSFKSKTYAAARDLYTQAQALMPNETYPQTQMNAIDQLLKDQEAQRQLEGNYNQLISQADQAFQNENYQNAKSSYTEAISIKSDEAYPKDRIRQINDILAEQERLAQIQQEFNAAVQQAESAFSSEDYELSKEHFQTALELKADASEVIVRIADIDRLLAQLEEDRLREEEQQRALAEAQNKAYQDALDEGNQYLTDEAFDQARTSFRKAKETKPSEFLPDELIARVDSLQAEYEKRLAEERAREEARQQALLAETDKAYEFAVQKGDSLYDVPNLELAKIQFETAISIKPDEQYPKTKLADIEGKIAKLVRLTDSYNKAVEEANQFVQRNEYADARSKYEEALQYLPNEDYPKRQIERIDEIMAQQEQEQAKEASYLAAIQAADALFNQNVLEDAKEKYQEASALKPGESYPVERIRDIDLALAELAREKARKDATLAAYQSTIQKADQEFETKDYGQAKLSYMEASALMSEETYPKSQIDRIDQLLLQEKENDYQVAIAKADKFFNDEKYPEAIGVYNEALVIKANDTYANKQIQLINQLLERLAQDERSRQQLENSYLDKMNLAGTAYRSKQYQNAKGYYNEALVIKPNEELPVQQIARIGSILTEIDRQAELDKLYDDAIRDGQMAFSSQQLQDAISLYQKAAEYKPEETLPPQRISEIESMIARQAEIDRLSKEEEDQRLARQKAEQEKYDAAIASGDQAFLNKSYRESKQFYTNALSVKPDEFYPKNRIIEIEGIIESLVQAEISQKQEAYQDSIQKALEQAFELKVSQADQLVSETAFESGITAYQEAIQILPVRRGDVTPKINAALDQIRILKEQQVNYDRSIVLADQYFNEQSWQNALNEYQKAIGYKPEEVYPQDRIRSIQQTIKAREDNYSEAVRLADEFFIAGDWFKAKDRYNEALTIKASEKYPKDQIALADQRIKAGQDADRASMMKGESYNQAIARGEKTFLNRELSAALTHFKFAKEIKPNETYPDDKIDEINRLIAQQEKEAENDRQQRLVDDRYRQAISLADISFRAERYDSAKDQYRQALNIKSEEEYPKAQIKIIDKILLEQQTDLPVASVPVKQSEPVYVPVKQSTPIRTYTQVANKESSYDGHIRQADQAYQRREYVVAQFYYRKATVADSEKQYPVDRITEIDNILNQAMKAEEIAAYNTAIQKADDAFRTKKYSISRFYYYEALELKSWENYPKNRIEEITTLTNSRLSEREEEAYRNLISKADDAFYRKELSVARSYYQQALGIKSGERYPKIKLKDISAQVKKELKNEVDTEYQKYIDEGDRALNTNNLSIARFYYNKALNVKPEEKYPKMKLAKIKQLLSAAK